MTMWTRRQAAAMLAGIGAAAVAPSAFAQSGAYPARQVRLIVPYPAGTANEVFSRVIANRLTETWKHQVLVEPLPGAGGVIGTQALLKTAPDGYTLGYVSSPHAINAAIYRSLPYDPIKDIRPIVNFANTPLALVAAPNLGVKTVAELVEQAKARPGALMFASNGNGSASHLASELLALETGFKARHVPYTNTGQMIADLTSGRANFAALGLITALPHLQTGKLAALGVTGKTPSALLPEVPTVEATVPGYEAVAWMGLIAPAGTPDAVVERVRADAIAAVRDPEVQKHMTAQGLQEDVLDAEGFRARIERDIERWKRVVDAAGIKID